MTDPEQETGPPDHAPKMPPEWRARGWEDRGDGLARPDPNGPDYPRARLNKREAREFDALDNDPDTQEALAQLRAKFQNHIERVRALFALPPPVDNPAEETVRQRIVETFLDLLVPAITETVNQLPPHAFSPRTRRHYFAQMLLLDAGYPPEVEKALANEGVGPRAGLTLLANFTDEDRPQEVMIPRGGFLMVFTHDTQTDRRAFDPLINAAQAYLGYPLYTDRGGRRRLEATPEGYQKALEADELQRQGVKPTEVGRRLGFDQPRKGRPKARQALPSKAKRYARRGAEILRSSEPSNPTTGTTEDT